MGYAGKIISIYLSINDNNEEAVDIVDTIAEEDNRSGRQVAEILIIRAGKERAEKIKERKAAKAEAEAKSE